MERIISTIESSEYKKLESFKIIISSASPTSVRLEAVAGDLTIKKRRHRTRNDTGKNSWSPIISIRIEAIQYRGKGAIRKPFSFKKRAAFFS